MAPLMMTMIFDATPAPQAIFYPGDKGFRREFITKLFDREMYANERERARAKKFIGSDYDTVNFDAVINVTLQTIGDIGKISRNSAPIY